MDRDEYIKERLEQGATYTAVGDELGVTRERIRQIARTLGIAAQSSWPIAHARIVEKRAKAVAIRQERKAERIALMEKGVALVRAGMSIKSAEASLGIKREKLGRYIRTLGVKSQHGRWHEGGTPRSRRVVELLRAGVTQAQAARETGYSQAGVHVIAKRNGLLRSDQLLRGHR